MNQGDTEQVSNPRRPANTPQSLKSLVVTRAGVAVAGGRPRWVDHLPYTDSRSKMSA